MNVYNRELPSNTQLARNAFRPRIYSDFRLHVDCSRYHGTAVDGGFACATKDNEVVEYALSRTLSPALVAEYQTQLPDKKLLQAKLHEFYAQNSERTDDGPAL